jgi:hypothetical protein
MVNKRPNEHCTKQTKCKAFSLVVPTGTLPPPHPQVSVYTTPPPLVPGGGPHSFAGEGVGGPNSDEETDIVVLYVYYISQSTYTYC